MYRSSAVISSSLVERGTPVLRNVFAISFLSFQFPKALIYGSGSLKMRQTQSGHSDSLKVD